jgi:uncharacterized spore protein YtfJ
MKLDDITSAARDTVTARRVFGDPVERDGVALLPAATVTGGAGGGGGHDATGQEGEGGGLGVRARPAGAYVVSGGDVHWRPAVDVNRIVTVAGAVAITYLLTRTHLEAVRSRTERRHSRRRTTR